MTASFYPGGIRVASFVSGGWLPTRVRGTVSHALIATADWYGTFAALAGVDPSDGRAAEHGLPPIDSVDQSKVLLGTTLTSARADIILGGVLAKESDANPRAIISSMAGDNTGTEAPKLYKLLLGSVPFASWCGPRYPNASSGQIGASCKQPVLFLEKLERPSPLQTRRVMTDTGDVCPQQTNVAFT